MKFLNSQQLAFILDIKKEDARAMMCNAWCKIKGIENTAERNAKNKVIDPYPPAMPIDLLSEGLNLPTLQDSVNDIINNYLVRPASKKYILCDLPEKQILLAKEKGEKAKLKIPPALKSMLPIEVQRTIHKEWEARHRIQ